MMKLDIQLFGSRGATSGSNGIGQTFTKGSIRFKVTKNSRGLYDYRSQEYSAINKKWVNMAKGSNFSRNAIQDYLDIRLKK